MAKELKALFSRKCSDPKTPFFIMIPVMSTEDTFRRIERDLQREKLRLVSMYKVCNLLQKRQFDREREDLEFHRKEGFKVNERELYHGTTAPPEVVCEEGLDARLSRKGHFGRGIYFSDSPVKCLQYARGSGAERILLVCSVILGDSKVYAKGEKDPDLVREPLKPSPTHGWKYYDSVQGVPRDFTEFVVYSNNRVKAEFLIAFRPLDAPEETNLASSNPIPDALQAPQAPNDSGNARMFASSLVGLDETRSNLPDVYSARTLYGSSLVGLNETLPSVGNRDRRHSPDRPPASLPAVLRTLTSTIGKPRSFSDASDSLAEVGDFASSLRGLTTTHRFSEHEDALHEDDSSAAREQRDVSHEHGDFVYGHGDLSHALASSLARLAGGFPDDDKKFSDSSDSANSFGSSLFLHASDKTPCLTNKDFSSDSVDLTATHFGTNDPRHANAEATAGRPRTENPVLPRSHSQSEGRRGQHVQSLGDGKIQFTEKRPERAQEEQPLSIHNISLHKSKGPSDGDIVGASNISAQQPILLGELNAKEHESFYDLQRKTRLASLEATSMKPVDRSASYEAARPDKQPRVSAGYGRGTENFLFHVEKEHLTHEKGIFSVRNHLAFSNKASESEPNTVSSEQAQPREPRSRHLLDNDSLNQQSIPDLEHKTSVGLADRDRPKEKNVELKVDRPSLPVNALVNEHVSSTRDTARRSESSQRYENVLNEPRTSKDKNTAGTQHRGPTEAAVEDSIIIPENGNLPSNVPSSTERGFSNMAAAGSKAVARVEDKGCVARVEDKGHVSDRNKDSNKTSERPVERRKKRDYKIVRDKDNVASDGRRGQRPEEHPGSGARGGRRQLEPEVLKRITKEDVKAFVQSYMAQKNR